MVVDTRTGSTVSRHGGQVAIPLSNRKMVLALTPDTRNGAKYQVPTSRPSPMAIWRRYLF